MPRECLRHRHHESHDATHGSRDRREQRDRRGDRPRPGRRRVPRRLRGAPVGPDRASSPRRSAASRSRATSPTSDVGGGAGRGGRPRARRAGQQRRRRLRRRRRSPTADVDDWRAMYDVNVLGTLNVTQALLPALLASGDGVLINMGSTAGRDRLRRRRRLHRRQARRRRDDRDAAPRAGRAAGPDHRDRAGHGQDRGVRPGPLPRRRGASATRSTRASRDPLTADDIADAVAWVATRPSHVNIDLLVVRPRAQAAQTQGPPRVTTR